MFDRPPWELVLPRVLWDATLPQLLLQPRQLAVGTCRRSRHDRAEELLVESLQTTDRVPSGADRPSLSDWVVLAAPGQETEPARVWLDRLQPRKHQLLAVALLGLGADRSAWDGAVVENGVCRPLEAIRVVGPGMLRAARETADPEPHDLLRWSRTRGALGQETWRKLSAAHVLLLGAGRTGSALAFQLAALGIRGLTIVDPDRLGPENLDAEYCVAEDDIGRAKVDALQQRLHAFRSDCRITSCRQSAAHPSIAVRARAADLIVTCVDHDTARHVAAELARRFLKVHLDVGTGVTWQAEARRLLAADVRLLLPRSGCVCCVGGLPHEAEARYELNAPPGALPTQLAASSAIGVGASGRPARIGSLITLNSLAVATAVQLWLDLLAGEVRSSQWHRLRWRPGSGLQIDAGPVGSSPDCRLCR